MVSKLSELVSGEALAAWLLALYGTEMISPTEASESTKYVALVALINELRSNINSAYTGIREALNEQDIPAAIAVLDQAILDLSELQYGGNYGLRETKF